MKTLNNETKEICEKNQERFDAAFDLYFYYIDNNDKVNADKQWKIMWECVYFACLNHSKKMVNGLINSNGESIQIQDLDGKACDASIKIMLKVKENRDKITLSAYPYWWCYGEIFGKKQERIDKELDMSLFDNTAYLSKDDKVYICGNDY